LRLIRLLEKGSSTIEAMMRAVHRYEGTVNKVLGDGIMALFGAPTAHEDHAVRACYAALAMQNTLREISEKTRRDFGVEVQVRTALHWGRGRWCFDDNGSHDDLRR
jgi:class 3 adenylate cyclase